ncbi:MAG: DnaK suppressor protein [Chlamydiota bacterium]|jgi:DnaK suppressor protein
MALKKPELEKFRRRLEELRKEMTHSIRDISEDVKNADASRGYSQHQADEGTDDFNRTVNLELTSKEFTVLRQIERALEKMDEGTYGVCDISGDPIPMPRLEAVPYATTTVQAQEKLEKGLL